MLGQGPAYSTHAAKACREVMPWLCEEQVLAMPSQCATEGHSVFPPGKRAPSGADCKQGLKMGGDPYTDYADCSLRLSSTARNMPSCLCCSSSQSKFMSDPIQVFGDTVSGTSLSAPQSVLFIPCRVVLPSQGTPRHYRKQLVPLHVLQGFELQHADPNIPCLAQHVASIVRDLDPPDARKCCKLVATSTCWPAQDIKTHKMKLLSDVRVVHLVFIQHLACQ